jgi:hypothetical protein
MSKTKHNQNMKKTRIGYDKSQSISKSNPVRSKFKNQWLPPKGSRNYFSMSSDEAFKRKHPIGYVFAVFLGIAALLLPAIIYSVVVSFVLGETTGLVFIGSVGGFIFGVGLFNFVAIILKQYLGHLVSIACFFVGLLIMIIMALL